jgi:hypothetical protein
MVTERTTLFPKSKNNFKIKNKISRLKNISQGFLKMFIYLQPLFLFQNYPKTEEIGTNEEEIGIIITIY